MGESSASGGGPDRSASAEGISEGAAWRYVVETLTLLAAEPEDQVAWLDGYRLETDDLAEDFGNAGAAIAVLVDAGSVNVALQTRLARIDAVLDAMSGAENAAQWAYTALPTDAGWARVRAMAREALVELTGTWRHPLPTLTTD